MTVQPTRQRQTLKQIGLWGAPGSGKTTYLAALSVACTESPLPLRLYGRNDEATEFLAEYTHMLTMDRRFPPATQVQRELSWILETTIDVPEKKWYGRSVPTPQPYQLNIELLDAPGRQFGVTPAAPASSRISLDDDDSIEGVGDEDEALMEHLAMCDGVVLLIDPMRERAEGDAFTYFNRTLLRIAQLRSAIVRSGPGYLPQHLAVCVTKFDEPAVLDMAKRRGVRSYQDVSGYSFPAVDDEDAESFFDHLCRVADRGYAHLIAGAIKQNFMKDRVRYFITSAIGFYVEPNGRGFRSQNSRNTVRENGQVRIRGAVHPINVVEPLLWLCQRLGTASRA